MKKAFTISFFFFLCLFTMGRPVKKLKSYNMVKDKMTSYPLSALKLAVIPVIK